MISPRWRMVLRDLWANWERALLVTTAIAVGVFGVGSLLTGYAILVREINAGYMATNPASARLWTDRIDQSLLASVAKQPGISAAETRRTAPASLLVAGGQWEALSLVTPTDFSAMRFDRFGPDKGAWPPGPGEILIERSSMPVAKTAIGSWVTVKTPRGTLRRLKVAGTAHDAGVTPGWMSRVVYGYVSEQTLTLLGEPRTFGELKVGVSGNTRDEAGIRRTAFGLMQTLESSGHRVSRVEVPKPAEHPNMSAMQLILQMMLAFAGLSLLLSGLLVFNLVSGIIARQTRQIGVMKAIGATTAQVMGVYMGMVAGLGLLGVAIALPLGWAAGRGFAQFVLGIFNLDLVRSDCPPWVFIAQIAVGVVVPVVAAVVPAYRGSSTTVLAALRDAGPGDGAQESWIDLLLARVGGMGRSFALSLRNTFRRKGRLAMTLVALSLGGAVFMTAVNVAASLTATINRSYDRRDYDVEMRLARSFPRAAVERIARGTSGVAAAEAWQLTQASVVRADGTLGNEVTLTGIDPQTPLIAPPLATGEWLATDDGPALVVTPTLAEQEPQMRVGNSVTLRIDDRESTWLVKGVAREVGSGMAAYAPYRAVSAAGRSAGLANDVRLAAGSSEASAVQDAAHAADRRLEDAGMPVVWSQTVSSSRQVLINHVAITLTFLMLASILSSVVGAMGLASTMSINVLERTREIGVMRAVGATTHALLRIVVLEGLFISVASWAAAVVLSIPLTRVTSTVPAAVFVRAPLDEVFSATGVWLWLAIVIVVGMIASLVPAWRAARAPVPETLAYE